MDTLSYLNGKPTAHGDYKQFNADFIVKEDLGYELTGEGEHLFVHVKKEGLNTTFVAEQLAKFAGIPQKLVSYAGLKDRNAVTEQWFNLHIPGKSSPDFSLFTLDGCEILDCVRHNKKLRIGHLKGNRFLLTIRNIDNAEEVEQKLGLIAQNGVPNYFGEQRFGFRNNNLTQAALWANGEITVKDRKKRSFYLSAMRSAVFNDIASNRILEKKHKKVMEGDVLQLAMRGSWFVGLKDELDSLQTRVNEKELMITAPMIGDNALGTQADALDYENSIIESKWADFHSFLKKERVETMRRAILLYPQQMKFNFTDEQTLLLDFWLPAGSYATSVLRELIV